MGSSWALCQDIGRRHTAIVAGFMNMMGNFGGVVAAYMAGTILDWRVAAHATSLGLPLDSLTKAQEAAGLLEGYHWNFYVFAAVHVIGVLCWLVVDSTKPVSQEE
jgi:nitrate/nitrite transporter NarK